MVFDFDKIYVIQSLEVNKDSMTGTALFNDVLRYFKTANPEKDAQLFSVNNLTEFRSTINEIKIQCENFNLKPIIHFEMHGLENRSGLVLSDKSRLLWSDLYRYWRLINEASHFNLVITMATCFGNWGMTTIFPTHPAPFKYIIGTFNEVYEDDLYASYNSFYSSLLYGGNLNEALDALLKANTQIAVPFRMIDAEEVFKGTCQRAISKIIAKGPKQAFKEGLAKSSFKVQNRTEYREKSKKFEKNFYPGIASLIEEYKRTFFMFDKFPENKTVYCLNWKPKLR